MTNEPTLPHLMQPAALLRAAQARKKHTPSITSSMEALLIAASDNHVDVNSIPFQIAFDAVRLFMDPHFQLQSAVQHVQLQSATAGAGNGHDGFVQLLGKARDATNGGVDAWTVQSTGEKLAVALVLNRPQWLESMGYTIAEALSRVGPDWVTLIPKVAQVLADESPEGVGDSTNGGHSVYLPLTLGAENAALKARISELEDVNTVLGERIDKLYVELDAENRALKARIVELEAVTGL